MSQTVSCPNCKAPTEPNLSVPFIKCTYCGQTYKNPLRQQPGRAALPGTTHKYLWIMVAAPVVLIAVSGVVTQLVFTAGTRPPPPVPAVPAAPSAVPEAAEPVDPRVQLEDKLDKYLDCLSRSYPRARDSMDRYLSWVKPKQGPTCKERYLSWGLYALLNRTGEYCTKSVEQATKAAPSLPALQDAATQYLAAVKVIDPLLAEAAKYYSKKLYALDDCARGQSLHSPLLDAFHKLQEKRDALRRLLEEQAKGGLQRCAARMKASPELVAGHHWASLVRQGGDTLGALREQAAKKKPDLAAIKTTITAFNKRIIALYTLEEKQQKAVDFSWTHKRHIDDFLAAGMAFLKSKGGRRLDHSARFQTS